MKELSFLCDRYKDCQISALAIYDHYKNQWVPKAHLFWQKRNQKHLATVTTGERFSNSREAKQHALELAHRWVDDHPPGFA